MLLETTTIGLGQEESTVRSSRQITPKVLITTDFSPESERAFYHALAFTVAHQARLTLLHIGAEGRDAVPWGRFPGVRTTLTKWGLLPADAPRTAVAETLHIDVAKMAMRDHDPRLGITDYLRKHPTDLLVMATEGRTGLARLFNPSVADHISYLTKSHTLMLPKGSSGFVDPETGRSALRRVLCALDFEHDQRAALVYLKEWLPALSSGNAVEIVLLHSPATTDLLLPQRAGLTWHRKLHEGEPIEGIIATAQELAPQLVILSTRGPLGIRGRLRGSPSDRALRDLGVPLLSVPDL
jgi:nucleotide-binding universal stress UspA family protein